VPAVAVKVALEELNGIVTLAGTDGAVTLELNPTTTGLLVAAALRPTVHVVAAGLIGLRCQISKVAMT